VILCTIGVHLWGFAFSLILLACGFLLAEGALGKVLGLVAASVATILLVPVAFAFVTLQYAECYSYRNISEIHVIAIDNVRESFTIPLRKSRGLMKNVVRKIYLYTKESVFWIEINDSGNDVRIHSVRTTSFGICVIHSCFEVASPEVKRELTRKLKNLPDFGTEAKQ